MSHFPYLVQLSKPIRDLDVSKAACAGMGEETFFPEDGDQDAIQAAKKICRDCPIRTECFRVGYDNRLHGIWGGSSERERNSLRNKLREREGAAA